MSTTMTTKPAGRAELKGGLVALSLAAIVGGWAALTSGQTRQADAQAEPPPPPPPPAPAAAQPLPLSQWVELPPIPTVVPLIALTDTTPAGQLSPIPSVVAAPAQSNAAPVAQPIVTAPAPASAPSYTAPVAPSLTSRPPVYMPQQPAPSSGYRIRTRSSR